MPADQIEFRDNRVFIGNRAMPFARPGRSRRYVGRVSLSSTGFYATPKIHWDREGRPAGRSTISPTARPAREVLIDTLTGEMKVDARRHPPRRRAARSIRRSTSARSRAASSRAWAGSPPRNWCSTRMGGCCTPRALDLQDPVRLRRAGAISTSRCGTARNREDTIYRSKAVGEPPLMLAISVFAAIADAIHSAQSGPAGAARRAGDAGSDPARRAGGAR